MRVYKEHLYHFLIFNISVTVFNSVYIWNLLMHILRTTGVRCAFVARFSWAFVLKKIWSPFLFDVECTCDELGQVKRTWKS